MPDHGNRHSVGSPWFTARVCFPGKPTQQATLAQPDKQEHPLFFLKSKPGPYTIDGYFFTMKHLKTHLLIMMLYLSLSLLLETTTASAEDKQAETAVNQTLMADVVSLESAGYSEFSSRLKDSRVPPSASDIWVSSIGVIDGHEQFIRYVSPQKDFIEACGAFCTDRNAVHKLPPVWPTSEDLEIPRWFTMVPECDQMRAWLTLDTHPYITEMYGEKVHCGYTQVAGILIGRNAATHTTYIFDFSIQWYRTGCGG